LNFLRRSSKPTNYYAPRLDCDLALRARNAGRSMCIVSLLQGWLGWLRELLALQIPCCSASSTTVKGHHCGVWVKTAIPWVYCSYKHNAVLIVMNGMK